MVIAVEKGLEDMKQQLENRGYDCFYIGENRVADAVLYKDRENHPYFEVNRAPLANAANTGASYEQAALLINAGNRSIDEIIRILTTKTYSPLF